MRRNQTLGLRNIKMKSVLCLCISFGALYAQSAEDSLSVWVTLEANVSPSQVLPFYHYFLQEGRWSDKNTQALTMLGTDIRKTLPASLTLNAGIECYVRTTSQALNLQQAYAVLAWKKLHFLAGKQSLSETYLRTSPSIGDLGISQNASPIPKIGFYIRDYITLPLLPVLSFKGSLYHGYLSSNRHISRPYWHEKSLFIRLSPAHQRFALDVGVQHFAIWGGSRHGQKIYAPTLKNYASVFFGKPIEHVESINAGGSHIGVINYTVQYQASALRYVLFAQHLFEDGRSAVRFSRLFGDGLVGLSLHPYQGFLRVLQYTFMDTRHQGGPGLPDPTTSVRTIEENKGYEFYGRDDIYNNYFYESGYTFKQWVIGNPLLTTKTRASSLQLPIQDYEGIVWNNRVLAHHISLVTHISESLRLTYYWIYTRNHGTYSGKYEGRTNWGGKYRDPEFQYFFDPVKTQHYFRTFVDYVRHPSWTFRLSIAADTGQIYRSWGIAVRIRYVFTKTEG